MEEVLKLLGHNMTRAARVSIKPDMEGPTRLDASNLRKFEEASALVFREVDRRCEQRGINTTEFYRFVLERL